MLIEHIFHSNSCVYQINIVPLRTNWEYNSHFVQKGNNNMYSRELQNKLLELSKHWSIISVTGPRQSGKIMLCKMAFPDQM